MLMNTIRLLISEKKPKKPRGSSWENFLIMLQKQTSGEEFLSA